MIEGMMVSNPQSRSAMTRKALGRWSPMSAGHGTTRVQGGRRVTCMVGRKVVTEDKDWSKGLGSVGIFFEEKESLYYKTFIWCFSR